jgi:Family of unknown function (DUF6941)
MPEIDFMVVSDYVRAEGGVLHMIAGGVDRIQAANVPTAHNVGVAIRLSMTRAECDRVHRIELIFQTQDGAQLLKLRAEFQTAYPEHLPPGWPAFGIVPLNIGLPIPDYGIYSLEVLIDDQHKKSVGLLVEGPRPPQALQG